MDVTPDETCKDLMEFLSHFKTIVVSLAEEHGLTMVQAAALTAISRNGTLPMGKVADTLHCDASNVTGIVDRLVAQGLIERRECPQDRRAKALQLTDKGQQVTANLQAQLPERLGCSMLTATEREALQSILAKLSSI